MKYAEENSKEGAVQQWKDDCKWFCEWCKQKETLEEMKKRGKCSCKRPAGVGQKATDEEMEDFFWLGCYNV